MYHLEDVLFWAGAACIGAWIVYTGCQMPLGDYLPRILTITIGGSIIAFGVVMLRSMDDDE